MAVKVGLVTATNKHRPVFASVSKDLKVWLSIFQVVNEHVLEWQAKSKHL